MPRRNENSDSLVQGTTSPQFDELRREFARNFAQRGELGAACAVYHRGEKVVDLWGGYRDAATREPWQEDTLVLVFSTSKGLAAMVMAVAHSRGLFDLDDRVAKHWPEFAQAGKQQVTIRQLLSHQAGLPVVRQRLTPQRLANHDLTAQIIAKQRPQWQPGTRHGYHTLSLGWYQSELIRRVDPQGRSLGQFFQDEIARPLDAEFYIGLPDDVCPSRLATVEGYHPLRTALHLNQLPRGMAVATLCPWSLVIRSVRNPRLRSHTDLGSRDYCGVEIPSANGIGQARAVAKAYSVFATGGRELALSDKTLHELSAPIELPSRGPRDAVIKNETAYSFGFSRPSRGFPFGSSDSAFGSPGAGGSFGFADPDQQLGFAYVNNKMGFRLFDDPREKALREACYRCLRNLAANTVTAADDRSRAA